jgi:hypothetical protein
MLNDLIDNYLKLTLEYRKAVARRQTLYLQNKNTKSVEIARNREKEIGKTILTLRKRILIERNKQKTKFNKKIAKAIACIVIETHFNPTSFVDELKLIHNDELFSMINAIDSSLSITQIKKVIKCLHSFLK